MQENVSIKRFFNELEIAEFISAYTLYNDNKTSIILTKNIKSPAKTKHIDVQYHYIQNS